MKLYTDTPQPTVTTPIGALPSRRATKIRISWYVLGVLSGVAVSSLISHVVQHRYVDRAAALIERELNSALSVAQASTTPLAPLAATAETAALPSLEGLDVVAIEAPKSKPEIAYPLSLDLEVRRGDTLLTMLTDTQVAYDEAYDIVESVRKIYNPRRLGVGQNVAVKLDKSSTGETPFVASLTIPVSKIKTIELTRSKDGDFKVKEVKQPLSKTLARAGGRISGSLYQTGLNAGIPAPLLGEIINAYSYDVDFQREIKENNRLDVLFERLETENGDVAGYGNVIYASLDLGGGKVLKVYRYTDKAGQTGYYNLKGESVKKALLRTPMNGSRISSGFGMRLHPILGYSKMHKGVDFAAASGTPIYAAGDGVVEMAGRNGSYGNYVRIKHNEKYSSAYAHTSRFAKGIRPGVKVRQGQVIAYVGTTGRSTGPHLHYEILAGNTQVNPASMKFKTGNSLSGRELASFKQDIKQIETRLASLPMGGKVQLASAQMPEISKNAKN